MDHAMSHPDGDGEIDGLDFAIIDSVRDFYQATDPVPRELLIRVRFALDLDSVERELAMVGADLEVASAVRGPEHARTITFDCDSLTIAITISPADADLNRVDGWLAPAASLLVELRTADMRMQTTSDEGGRFSFDNIAAGEVQFAVLPRAGSAVELDRTVVTQPIVL
jgi:hypothetical protein